MRSTSTNSATAILVKARERKSIENSSSIFCRKREGRLDAVLFSRSDVGENGGECSPARLPLWPGPDLTGSCTEETFVGIWLSRLNAVWDFA